MSSVIPFNQYALYLDRASEEQLVAVYDLGGVTFDVSIVEFNQGILEVRASHGNTHLGGNDFDDLLVTLLGEFRFEGMAAEKGGGMPPSFTMEFDLDLNGILRVSAAGRGGAQVRQTTRL